MKKTKLTRSLLAACSIVALSAVMYGCVHSGSDDMAADDPPPPPPAAVDLMGSTDLMPGMTTIAAGASVTVGNTTLTCSADADCVVTVMQDDVTGAYSATATGGTVTVAVAEPPAPPTPVAVDLMGSTDLMAGMTTVPAGTSMTVGDTTLTCTGTEDCMLTVAVDSVTGGMTATSTGGTVTVAVAPPPTPPMEYTVTLPEGHGLADGMTNIAAGETVMLSNGTELTCDGTEACSVTVSTDGVTGVTSASSTGGMVTVTTAATRMAAEQERIRLEHEGHKETLRLAEEELARVQALYDAGDATANELQAAKDAVTDAMMLAGNQPPPPPEPVVVAASGSVSHDALQKAFEDVLDMPGDSDTFTIPAGETAVRGGITFTCDSERPCTVTITNSVGTIVASWMSYDVDDDEAMVVASHPDDLLLIDPLHPTLTLNPSNAANVQAIIDVAIEAAAVADTSPHGARGNASTTIGGLDLDGYGVVDMSKTTLTSELDINGPDYDGTADPPTGGSTLMVPRDLRSLHADRTALEGWAHSKVLFADWGDTAGDGDGGFETAALLYSDHEAPTAEDFDDTLAAKLAHHGSWFALTVLADGETGATSVAIATNTPARQVEGMVFDSGSLVPAQNQDLNVDEDETFSGSYFGAQGTFQCTGTGCALMRNDDGTVGLVDTGDAEGIQGGAWSFTPDADQTVMIPDQDYMVFGAWLTVPDAADTGEHRIGVFYDGMQEYGTVPVALTGMATYEGGAAGVYRDLTASGMFTADATLTADFGDDGAAGMLSGRVDNFRNSNGVFLGTDTAGTPNDPATGGENDWVVTLTAAEMTDGTATSTSIAGSADGVAWTGGQWAAQLYGSSGTADDPIMPSGVAGQFRASSTERGVVGAFGATKGE